MHNVSCTVSILLSRISGIWELTVVWLEHRHEEDDGNLPGVCSKWILLWHSLFHGLIEVFSSSSPFVNEGDVTILVAFIKHSASHC